MTFYSLILSVYFLRTTIFSDIIFGTVIKFKKFNIDTIVYYSYSNFVNCSNSKLLNIFFSFSQGSQIAFSCHVSLVSFDLEQFFSLSLSFLTWTFFMNTGQIFLPYFF